MTVDFGAHLYPESVFPEPIAESPLRDLLGPMLDDPGELETIYENAGVEKAVLSQPFYMGLADEAATADANDALLEIINQSSMFYGLASIPTASGGEAAADEFERSLENGYHGGALETKTEGIELTDGELEPVFEVADQTGAPLLVHPKLDDSLHPEVLDDTYLLNATFGREAALSESLCKIIHEGVLDRYPNLNLVYHHLGGNIASMLGRIHLQLDDGRWPGQDNVKPFSEFKAQLQNRIFVDTSGFFGYEQPLRATLEEIPTSQILFGTDYPFEPRTSEEVAMFTETIDTVTGEYAEQILETNVERLLINL